MRDHNSRSALGSGSLRGERVLCAEVSWPAAMKAPSSRAICSSGIFSPVSESTLVRRMVRRSLISSQFSVARRFSIAFHP